MLVDVETGEILFDKFAKMFFTDIEKLFSLTPSQGGVFALMVKTMKIGNNNRIEMHPKRKKEFAALLQITTTNSISNILRQLEERDLIKREDEFSSTFIVNPSVFFKGNDYQHAQVITSYSDGKRQVRAFSSKKDLTSYILDNNEEGDEDEA